MPGHQQEPRPAEVRREGGIRGATELGGRRSCSVRPGEPALFLTPIWGGMSRGWAPLQPRSGVRSVRLPLHGPHGLHGRTLHRWPRECVRRVRGLQEPPPTASPQISGGPGHPSCRAACRRDSLARGQCRPHAVSARTGVCGRIRERCLGAAFEMDKSPCGLQAEGSLHNTGGATSAPVWGGRCAVIPGGPRRWSSGVAPPQPQGCRGAGHHRVRHSVPCVRRPVHR